MKITLQRAEDLVHEKHHYGKYLYKKIYSNIALYSWCNHLNVLF